MQVITVIITIIGIGVLAAAHEIAHYLVAKALGIKVYELSVFVGPKLFSWKKNDIEYNIRLIPFGAYVRFSDYQEDEESDTDDPRMILNQPRWKRLLVSLAGPFMNVILGVVILAVLFSVSGFYTTVQAQIYPETQLANTAVRAGDRILSINGNRVFTEYDLYAELTLTKPSDPLSVGFRSKETGKKYSVLLVPETQTAFRLGITFFADPDENGGWEIAQVDPRQNDGQPMMLEKDSVLSINGVSVTDPGISEIIGGSEGDALLVRLIRDGVEKEVSVKPYSETFYSPRGFDLKPGDGFPEAAREAFVFPVAMFKLTVFSVRSAISGDIKPYNVVSGPVGMVTIVSDVVNDTDVKTSVKAESLIMITAVISIGLAITNLLPLPGLDGSDLIMLIIETIRGKKVTKKTERVINVIGFVIIILLVSFALTSDIIRLLV
ncbi:MAG: RIP metalloprotease RseP [Clostridiaceae bacterium]|nr:RIP metalloprotease RseP [Oscillospiraceae bacterium]NLO61984.1 RIP metalloprotease RseP [Clostridiaceae bacterium]